ncbi:uncharacterized protein LOC123547349 [Mercenaria mercenaria]|uniref:uncharacterized protein LOC123547349 n=1 Tax=Mercenaria mercenaria TaxID=6596 RepID=UPI00234EA630|nr:uncharacterized protein LOC123547349 [Mercenaria mercenaria]
MNFSQKHYLCGFNGFKQISQCMSQTQQDLCDDAENSSHNLKEVEKVEEQAGEYLDICQTKGNANYFSVPQEVNTVIKLCTWSDIFGTTGDGKLTCYGNRSLSLFAKIKDDLPTRTVIGVGKDVLLQNSSNTVLLQDDGRICELTSDVEHVTLVTGTRDHVYGVKECQCFEGFIETSVEGQNYMTLFLHPISVNIEVLTVSCGFEHTLMLTRQGAVYSCGSASRGQLGHGEISVDLQKTPRCIDTFSGIFVISIAAGGWHSTAVTDSGDAYVWGWNESGQLGLPNGTLSTASHTSCHKAVVESFTSEDYDTELEKCPNYINLEGRTLYEKVDTVIKADSSDELSSKRKFTTELNEENTGRIHDFHNCTKCEKRTVTKSCEKNVFCEEHQDLKQHHNMSQTKSRRHSTDCVSGLKARDSYCVPQKYYQPVDCVQVQTVPYGLDFPDELCVKSVSCGTRHTCILSDYSILLTAGWNSYGQLCHGDTNSRDYFETVSFFSGRKEKIIDVIAQYWNTYIVTENI